ncbi:hypothetical protein [Pedobacter psychrodurus]|uniref:hypothetical protein n=1 Tax=Pedobacter psychrodurus TaxID=2530456 RepID=UPI00292CD685|nr:hypothetical protein [Pedobacter psychrodurus]
MQNKNKIQLLTIGLMLLVTLSSFNSLIRKQRDTPPKNERKIVNIVNFIRLLEPRDAQIIQDVLYQTVVSQVEIMKKYNLPGTFLLQYDALMDPRYQKLLSSLPKASFEIGAWWELPQPLIEKAGIKWRGKYAWDWHSDIGFSVGYTPAEREKIIDVYFADFKKIFGYYPKSVASWVIDAHSLNYMYDKYKIIASANCKDQVGTDGFTLWGGYWNQAYYPSRVNAYMPAQHAEKQLPVPVFRLLGSDPIRQYADGSTVTTLEPVYGHAGGNLQWINWFFQTFSNDPSLGFNYTQAGQENSFTWDAMKKGLEIQMPIIAQLREQGKVQVETMSQSGQWFKKNYKVTPATTFTVTKDLGNSDKKTIWYNSRFYRINLLWEKGSLRITDIHLFNETVPDKYLNAVTTTNQSFFYTLPVVDGFLWGKAGNPAGLLLMDNTGGQEQAIKGGDPIFTNQGKSTAHISWPVSNGSFEIDLKEKSVVVRLKGKPQASWFLDFNATNPHQLPLTDILADHMNYVFDNHAYQLVAAKGSFEKPSNGSVFRVKPQGDALILKMTDQ